jgi:cobalt/nickel transport system permease protein
MTRNRIFLAAGLVVALLLAGVVSFYASAAPDGLEKVAADKGLDAQARDHGLSGSPFADYGTRGVEDGRLSGGLAGVAGVLVTFGAGGMLFYLLRGREASRDASGAGASRSQDHSELAGGGRDERRDRHRDG